MKFRLLFLFLGTLIYTLNSQTSNIGIGTLSPQAKLDVAGGLKIGLSLTDAPGTLQFKDDAFWGKVNGLPSGWQLLSGPWAKTQFGNVYLSPALNSPMVMIGDSVASFASKLYVRHDLGLGGMSVLGRSFVEGQPVTEGYLGYQFANISPLLKINFGVLGNVFDDGFDSPFSYGVAGNNQEADTSNYGGFFVAQGQGAVHNIGVFGTAINGQKNWAGLFEGYVMVTDKLTIATDAINEDAVLQMNVSSSGNFPHLRMESPSDGNGYGIRFINPVHEFLLGQNIGNWNDGRFQIVPGNSDNWFTMLQNGNVGLTNSGFNTPFARLQVAPKGSLNDSGLNLDHAALYIGQSQATGMAFDENQIESVGSGLNLNYNSPYDLLLVNGGGDVGIDVVMPKAKLHVGEGKTVLFGNDTLGKTNFYPDTKLMFLPGIGGAFRVGQLNADGSLITGTGYNFWDPLHVGWASIAIGNNTKATGAGSVALGIRAHAANFGAVALGHLSRTKGNSGIAAGYYTRADAFVSCAVGAGNTGGGSPNSWNALDPIFEVGNSIDTTNRSNALTVLKNGRVGINHSNPQSMLDIEQPNPGPGNGVLMNLQGIGHWETGVDNAADYNFYFNNALKAYIQDTDGTFHTFSDIRLKEEIEPMANALSRLRQLTPVIYKFRDSPKSGKTLGLIAQEVQHYFPGLVSSKNGYLGVNYPGFSVVAIKAIQELSEQNELLAQKFDMQQKVLEQLLLEIENLKRDLARKM